MNIETRTDRKRGCGWRKPGGLYLVADGPSHACGKLPVVLDVCPTCHHGVKPSRSWTWVDGTALLAHATCALFPDCGSCSLARPIGKVGLIWVGGAFYKTPSDWTREAIQQGVSRRISALPKGFVLGETWVLVAHREAIPVDIATGEFMPGIFHAFKPSAVEYVVKDSDTAEQLAALSKRGITPIRVERVDEAPVLPLLSTSTTATEGQP